MSMHNDERAFLCMICRVGIAQTDEKLIQLATAVGAKGMLRERTFAFCSRVSARSQRHGHPSCACACLTRFISDILTGVGHTYVQLCHKTDSRHKLQSHVIFCLYSVSLCSVDVLLVQPTYLIKPPHGKTAHRQPDGRVCVSTANNCISPERLRGVVYRGFHDRHSSHKHSCQVG
jgi:hypothetical protein